MRVLHQELLADQPPVQPLHVSFAQGRAGAVLRQAVVAVALDLCASPEVGLTQELALPVCDRVAHHVIVWRTM